MESLRIKISELHMPEKNVRIHGTKQLAEYEKSVKMFGQLRPIVIDENNIILAGLGLYQTLVKMGKEEADVYRYTDLTPNQKKKLMIADNKIFSLGVDNLEVLNQFFEELNGDLEIPGFDEEILRQMVSDAEEITETISEYGLLDAEEIEDIKAAEERREQRGKINPPMAPEELKTLERAESMPVSEPGERNGDGSEVSKFIICPNCGEKIWL